MVRLRSLLMLALLLMPIVAPVMPAQAATIPLSEVDETIQLGIDAVHLALKPLFTMELSTVKEVKPSYFEIYVMPDHPSPTISVAYNGELYVPGSFLDPGDSTYKTELIEVTYDKVAWRYYFNIDEDDDYDVIIYAELRNVDFNVDQLYVNIEKAEHNIDVYIGTYYPYVYSSVSQGWSTTIDIDYWNKYKFYSARYVARHSTRLAAWLMEDEGNTYIANALHALMDMCSYVYDVYAPLFGRSIDYPDDFFTRDITWLGSGYECLPWTTDVGSISLNYPYKSRMYIFDAASLFSVAVRGWEEAPLANLLKAMHLLDKYGATAAEEAEQLIAQAIEDGMWDGYGIRYASIDIGYVTTGQRTGIEYQYEYAGYPVYLNAALLAALVKYYQVTGDRWIAGNDILYMADRLAGILVRLQWKYEVNTPWGFVRLALFRGWWPAAYEIGSLISKSSAWGIIDTLTHTADNVAGILAKVGIDFPPESLRPMPSEWPFALVNSESTILAVQALKLYRQLGREPIDPLSNIIAGFDGVFIDGSGVGEGIEHFGETSLDGRRVLASAFTSTFGEDAWHYQYARFKFNLGNDGYYHVRVAALVLYNGYDSQGSRVYVYFIIKLLNDEGIIAQTEHQVDNVDEDTLFDKGKSIVIELDDEYLTAGTYYIEVGLYVIADNDPISWTGANITAISIIDEIVLSQ